jgi:anti-sigma factor RsiW
MKFQEDAELSQLIQSKASYYEAPQQLRDKIAVTLGEIKLPAAEHRTNLCSVWQRWLGMGVAFACGVVFSIAVLFFRGEIQTQNRIASQVVAGHVRSLMVAHLSDVASTDQHTVKPWFSGKLDYSPPVKNLASDGFQLVGGRLDYMDERPVAALVYKHQLHTINVFVWPVRDASITAQSSMVLQGFNIIAWQNGGMQYWAVSDLNNTDLKQFADLLGK